MPVGVLPGLVMLAAAVRVDGSTRCPTPAMVAARLAELLPAAAGADPTVDRARLLDEGGELVVVVERANGEVVGSRRFSRDYACDGLASAVAVSVAVLASDVHPAFASTVPAAALSSRPTVVTTPLAVSPLPAAGWRWGAGVALGFGGSVDVPASGGELMLEAWARPPLAMTAVRADLEAQSERQIAVQDGTAAWRRFAFGLGVERALLPSADDSTAGWLRWFATARLALLDLRGDGFTVNHRARSLDAGVGAGLRAVAAGARWATWLELGAAAWPLGHELLVAPDTGSIQRLPVFEAFLRVGAGWGAGR